MVIFIILILLLIVAILILLERKILRLAQVRKRPNIIRFYRVLQTIIDRVKLLLKKYLLLPHFFCFFYNSSFFCFFLSLLL